MGLCVLYILTHIRSPVNLLREFSGKKRLLSPTYAGKIPSEKGEEIINNVNTNVKTIRYELGTRVRNQLRIIPELRFFIDDSLDYIDHIDELLKK